MWFKTMSRLRMELAEAKHRHNLELSRIKDEVLRDKEHWEQDKARLIKKITDEHEIKLREMLSLAKIDADDRARKAALDAESNYNKRVEELNKDFYKRLTDATVKLHEEGNINTKFTQEIALKMLEAVPQNRSQVKVITKGE